MTETEDKLIEFAFGLVAGSVVTLAYQFIKSPST